MFNNIIMNTFFNLKKYFFNNYCLDKYQSKAVFCNKKNYLVVAGAGSGKTLTIVAKVDYLIKNGINSKEILCISFTNETVKSLKNILEKNNLDVDVKTFHKLSLDILKKKYNISNSNLLEYVINEFFCSIIYYDNTYKLLEFIDDIKVVKNILLMFINKMKAYNYNELFLFDLLRNTNVGKNDKTLLLLALKIYIIYDEELKSENKIDFDDMITFATKEIGNMAYFKYKYIIIDEYQDTSICKYKLIKEIIDKFDISLMAVGDDYQSIYSFTGCNLKLFINFKKLFKNSKIIKLKNTYRNPRDIVEISKRFMLKNRSQIIKKLKSFKIINNSINIVYAKDEGKALKELLKTMDDVMVLGRNNRDIDKYRFEEYNCKNIRFLTVHSSKGLEENNVIILNVVDDALGFPNKIKSNNIFFYLDNFNYIEEERRLFYVAFTRAIQKVYIITFKGRESIFVKELIKDFKYKIKIKNL